MCGMGLLGAWEVLEEFDTNQFVPTFLTRGSIFLVYQKNICMKKDISLSDIIVFEKS